MWALRTSSGRASFDQLRASANGLLAARTYPKKLQAVRHPFEAVIPGDPLLQFRRKTFLDFNDRSAVHTDQMMVVPMPFLADQLKAGVPIAKIKPLHYAELL